MTNNQEDYIKIICEMKEKKLPVTNKAKIGRAHV